MSFDSAEFEAKQQQQSPDYTGIVYRNPGVAAERRNGSCYNSEDSAHESTGTGSMTDEDSNSSSRTLGSHDSSSLTVTSSGDFDEKLQSHPLPPPPPPPQPRRPRPLSEAIGKDDLNAIRLRTMSQPSHVKEHRTSADVYMLEDVTKNLSRYTTLSPSVSPKQQQQQYSPSTQQYDPYLGSSNYLHMADKSLACANYQLMQPYNQTAAIAIQQQQQRAAAVAANYANICRLNCDQCVTGSPYVPCHPYLLYGGHLTSTSPYWECDPSSFGMLPPPPPANNPYLPSTPAHLLRKVVYSTIVVRLHPLAL